MAKAVLKRTLSLPHLAYAMESVWTEDLDLDLTVRQRRGVITTITTHTCE